MLFLLDSSAVLNDFSFQFKEEHSYITTPLAFDELRDLRSRHLALNALQNGLLKIKEPGAESIKLVEKKVAEKGFSRLSKTDISLLALGLDLKKEKKKFRLVSDDYSIQNFCKLFKIPFESVIRGRIKETIAFALKCPACGKMVKKGQKGKKCPVCGSPLKQAKIKEKGNN
jgi:rRNA maturation endonuclease Nob1